LQFARVPQGQFLVNFSNLLKHLRDNGSYLDFALFMVNEPAIDSHKFQASANYRLPDWQLLRGEIGANRFADGSLECLRNILSLLERSSSFPFSSGDQSNNHATILYAVSSKFLTAITTHLIPIE